MWGPMKALIIILAALLTISTATVLAVALGKLLGAFRKEEE